MMKELLRASQSMEQENLVNYTVEQSIHFLETISRRRQTAPPTPVATVSSYYSRYWVISSTIAKICFFPAQFILFSFGQACYLMAVLLFLTDQIIGASSDELSSVVRWCFWANKVGLWLYESVFYFMHYGHVSVFFILLTFAVPLAVIIISDCLCQQWLDRTHKVTNPIKLIIQVLNYTRKHSYPERRSAFTYIDEEQPTRMDYGKEKFGGPFTEEEVEDVKTVLRLLPLVICLSAIETILIDILMSIDRANFSLP